MVVWIDAPTYAETAAAFPERARVTGEGGRALLTCGERADGTLKDCAVADETPGGRGFGAAARKLAARLRADRPAGAPVGADVRVIIAFAPQMARGGDYVASNPVWTALPSAADFQASFPKTANGVNSVRVTLVCEVVAGGALSACRVESEDPAGQGYGAGALALAPKIRVGLLTVDGVPIVGAKVRVPLRYELTPAKP